MRRQLDNSDFKEPAIAARAVNDALKEIYIALDLVKKRRIVSMDIQTGTTPQDSFPQVFALPGFTAIGVVLLKIANKDSPITLLSAGPTVQWRNTSDGRVAITSITGLQADTRYAIELEVISA